MLFYTYTTTGNESINELYDKRNKMIEDGTYNSSPHGGFSYKCCQNCPNNPANNPNASGICHCVLPSQEMVRF